MPSIDVIIETTPVYITVTPQTNPNIQVKFGAVDSVNGETGVVLINAVPNGGTTGQVLAKNSNTDNDTGWINVSAGGVQTLTGTTNRISIDNTDPANPIANIAASYDTAVTNAIAAAISDKEDTANKQTDLTPSATKYPTVNAVNAGLSLRTTLIARDNTISAPITGVTVETKLGNGLLIPANSVKVGKVLRLLYSLYVASPSGSSTTRLHINTVDSLSGATLIGIFGPIILVNPYVERYLNVRSATQTELMFTATMNGQYGQNQQNSNPPLILNIDWSVDHYIIPTYTPNITGSSTTRRLIDAILE